MRKSDHSPLANLASLLICGVLAGVVVAAAAFPAAALTGLAGTAASDAFGQLPDELLVKQSPQISYLYASDDKTLLATMYDENRRDLPLTEIPPVMQSAILAAEDQKFMSHNGVDAMGFVRAFVANKSAGGVEQGASTLTMQYVRLTLSYSAEDPEQVLSATEKTNARKAREIKYALAIEQRISKEQILEGYLNTAYFGNSAFGIFAASQVYFGKEPKDLTLAEAAFLAALPKFPGDFNVTTKQNLDKAIDRRDYVLDEMVQTGAINAEQATEAKAVKHEFSGATTPNGCVQAVSNNWGFFCDFFQRWWEEQEVFGATTFDRERQLKSGGYRVVTSLDVFAQNSAFNEITKLAKVNNSSAIMLAGVEPGTGRVQLLAANRNFKLDDKVNPQNPLSTNPAKRAAGVRASYPNTTNPLMSGGGDINGYQAGSVFKIYTLVAALEKGYPLDFTINAVPKYTTKYAVGGDSANCGGKWCPSNASPSMAGVHNMWSGFGSSVNTYFAPLIEYAGADRAIDVAKRLGVVFRAPHDQGLISTQAGASNFGAFTLGVTQTTPLDVANSFATLANEGNYCEPIPVISITDLKGNLLDVANSRCKKAVEPDIAAAAIDAARCPVGDSSQFGKCRGSTYGAARGIVGHHLAGKSGTTDGDKVATMTMTTKQLSVSGFMADPDWAETNVKMLHTGGVNPAVANTMREVMRGKPNVQFTKASQKMAYGNQVSIKPVTCKSPDEAKSILKGQGFKVEVDRGAPVNSPCPAGTVASTNPPSKTVQGGSITLVLSNGAGGGPATPPGIRRND
jgi:membrane peptidoglycan carboxypeptidase